LPKPFNLKQKARAFAGELAELLNGTICDGIRITQAVASREDVVVIGYRLHADDAYGRCGVPIRIGRRGATCYLGLSMHLAPDHQRQHLMTVSSVLVLALDADVSKRPLLHYDYERGKDHGYPEAHLHVCASSPAWAEVGLKHSLDKLHLPVGGRRFRPTVEDAIEFLISEGFTEGRDGWEKVLEAGRGRFQERQLAAAVRREPEIAIRQLRDMGYRVQEPVDRGKR
jgi:GNAT superfamily N-acetyltransferase